MIELTIGVITAKKCCLRFASLFKNRWHNIEELIDFDAKEPSTFFINPNGRMPRVYPWMNE